MDLINVRAFTRTVEVGGVSQAARALGVSKSTVSRRIAWLEKDLGARLLERSARAWRVTDAGRHFYDHGLRLLAQWEAATAGLSPQGGAQGVIRLSAPTVLGKSALPQVLADFMAESPRVRVHSEFSNRRVNPIEEGFDIVLRGGDLPDSSLIGRRVATTFDRLYAAPSWLARHGPVATVEDLRGAPVLQWAALGAEPVWLLQSQQARATVAIDPLMVTCDTDVMCRAATAGHGIARLPEFVGRVEVQAGRLLPVLPEWSSEPIELHLIYPSHKSVSVALRAVADALVAGLAEL